MPQNNSRTGLGLALALVCGVLAACQPASEKPDNSAQPYLGSGESFLAENKTRKGVHTTASGLQYEVLKEGRGPTPGPTDTVSTHYTGSLLSGKVFDSSVERGVPVSFPVNGVIKGWQEALQLMSVGSKWKLWIPSELAYGAQGVGPIGPNQTLVFEVELISIEPAR